MRLEAQWIVGFVDGEGCFHITIKPHKEMKTGYQVLPEFAVVQHEQDIQVLYALKKYFGCGVVRLDCKEHISVRMAYRVRSQEHLLKIIIPFFMKHPLKTQKHIEFKKFRRVLLKMEKGMHLTEEGIVEIRTILSQINRLKDT